MLNQAQLAFLKLIEARLVRVSSACKPDPEAVADLRGTYARWFRERGLRAVVMRPDYYVFGAAADLGDLPAVVDNLRHQLSGQSEQLATAGAMTAAGDPGPG